MSEPNITQRWPDKVALLEKWLDGETTHEEFAKLDAALIEHPELAHYASQRLSEHRLLGVLHQPNNDDAQCAAILQEIGTQDSAEVDNILNMVQAANLPDPNLPGQRHPESDRSRIRLSVWQVAGMAASLLLAGWIWWNTEANQPPQMATTSQSGAAVATMLLADECRWKDARVFAEGQRLSGRLELISGLAVLRFDGGAELILRGDSELELLSPGEAMLHRGDVVVRASDEAAGFRLLTPASELIDLGTEFSVRVAEAGATTLNVLDGEVSVRPLQSADANAQVLRAGRAIMVDDAQSAPREVVSTPERFDSVVERVHPVGRADLMCAYEGFFYDEGEVALSESRRGKGWVGPWRQRTEAEGFRADEDVSDVLNIVHGKMNVTWPVPGGEDGMLQLPPGKTFRVREMQKPIDLSVDGIFYFSFMVREPDYGNRPRRSRPQEGIRLTFRSNDDYYGEALSFGISPDLHPQIRTGRGVGFFSAADAPSDQTTLWIGKVIARANGEDEVSFRIFSESDELTYAEPSAWHVVSKGLDLSAQLNLTVLTSQGTAARIVDELRIGPTWRSVTPLRETDQ